MVVACILASFVDHRVSTDLAQCINSVINNFINKEGPWTAT
jgi:hypothetical protein